MKGKTVMSCVAAIGFTLGAATVPASDGADSRSAQYRLEGAWQVEVTVRVAGPDCATAPPVPFGPNPFPSFNTFHAGGTMSEWGSRAPPATRSSGHGTWERLSAHRYGYRFMFHSFDGNGLLTATMDFSTELELTGTGDTFEGVSRFVRTDLSGNALNFCATMAGQRISLQ
ncbi:MAG: hypothetical protein OEX13_12920 [Gammaproteobacteria bacterium]|nr:hypothetical protein [Gammaproteobacteria bacterium]